MKNLIKPLAMLLLAALTISSCKKDDKDEDTKPAAFESSITIDGRTYKLQNQGVLEDYGTDDGFDSTFQYAGTNFDVNLFTEGINLVYDSDGDLDSLYGPGLVFYFESFSSDPDRLADGTYSYHPNSPIPVGAFDFGYYATADFLQGSEITGGTFTVSSSGNTYTLVFDLTDADGKKITGTFKGTFKVS